MTININNLTETDKTMNHQNIYDFILLLFFKFWVVGARDDDSDSTTCPFLLINMCIKVSGKVKVCKI